jgi:hypothetical protein
MFDGWADPDKKSMYVYESSSATGGVVRRVIPYDASYQPMRLKSADNGSADQRAENLAATTEAVGATAPSRPATPGKPAPVSAERQRFLEANNPGESSVPDPKPTVTKTEIGVGDVPVAGGVSATPSMATTPKGETPEEKAVRDYLTNLKTYEAFNKRFQSAIEGVDTTMPAYKLPGLPTIDLGWRRQRFALPGAA